MAIFNVLDFGATANDLTDDSAFIQAAIDAAYEAGGGTVYIPAGTFIISGDKTNPSRGCIEVRSNVTLTGEGIGATVLKLADGYDERINGIVRTPVNESAINVTVCELTIDGNRQNNIGHQAGIITGVKANEDGRVHEHITISGVEVTNCTAYGVNPHEITYDLTIENCVSHNNGKDGFVADYVVGGVYKNNIAYDNDRHGFNIQNSSSDILLENNIAYDNGHGATGGAGIVVQRSDIFPEGENTIPWVTDVRIVGGEYYNNSREGILIKLSDNVEVSAADIHDNMRQGIRIEGATDTVIHDNEIYDNSREKLGSYDEINIRLRVDDVVNPPRTYYSQGTEIYDNNIHADGTSRYGIREELTNSTAGNPSGTVVHDNIVTGMRSGDIYIPPYGATQGDDYFYGTTSGENFAGLGGNDTYIINHTGDIVNEQPDAGNDTVIASLNYSLTTHVENLQLTGNAIRGTGNDLANIIIGNAQNNELEGLTGDDQLDGKAGADIMQGGDGNDTYFVDNALDMIIEKDHTGLGGVDTVISTVTHTLAAEAERLILQGEDNLDATGNNLVNELVGNVANNVLDGMAGSDVMRGGNGDDTYLVDHTGDTVIELAGEGFDTVLSSLTYTLGSDMEKLELTGSAQRDGTGNALGNVIIGNAGSNKLHGRDGDDTIEGGLGADQLYGDAGNDLFILRKGEFSGDVIEDFSGNSSAPGDRILFTGFSSHAILVRIDTDDWQVRDGDYLETFRIKTPAGTTSFDVTDYSFDGATPPPANSAPVASASGNSIAGQEDTVISGSVPAGFDADGDSLSYSIVAPLTGLTLSPDGTFSFTPPANESGTYNFQYFVADGFGGESAYQEFTITVAPVNDAPVAATAGNSASGTANTVINGHIPAGSDPDVDPLVYVQAGNLAGLILKPDGTFSYNPAVSVTGDVSFQYHVMDPHGAQSAAQTFTLSVAPAPSGITVTGNNSGNTLYGTDGNDIVDGGKGADKMYGHAGDDTYYVDSSTDKIFEAAGGGYDRIFATSSFTINAASEIELIQAIGASAATLKGNNLANTLIGNGAANTISGNDGDDIIDGGLGKDMLTGGNGRDSFVFSSALGTANVDQIKDFKVVDDAILLDQMIFSALAAGQLSQENIVKGTQALDATDQIIYNSSAGQLLYDADGAGDIDAVLFATIGKGLQIDYLDFIVYDHPIA